MDRPQRMTKRCQRDLQMIIKHDSDTFCAELVNGNLDHWNVSFTGAKETVYDGEFFKLRFKFTSQYVNMGCYFYTLVTLKYQLLYLY